MIDSPGLEFMEGRELKLERQVSSIIKYIDAQYADTMSEVRLWTAGAIFQANSVFQESKVVRKNIGDQHIHLYVFMKRPFTFDSQRF